MGLTLAGVMAEGLEALATEDSDHYEDDVKIGQTFTLKTRATITGECRDSGCSSSNRDGLIVPDAILRVRFCGSFAPCSPALTLAGDATFVSPVTGKIVFDSFDDPPVRRERLAEIPCNDIRLTPKSLDAFSVDGPNE